MGNTFQPDSRSTHEYISVKWSTDVIARGLVELRPPMIVFRQGPSRPHWPDLWPNGAVWWSPTPGVLNPITRRVAGWSCCCQLTKFFSPPSIDRSIAQSDAAANKISIEPVTVGKHKTITDQPSWG